jgi:hypothetical protein
MVYDYLQIFMFFTTWNVLLVIFNRYTYKYINLLYTSFITLFIGLYLSFINPRRFVFRFANKKYKFVSWEKFISIDIIFHIFVFLYIYYKYYFVYYKNIDACTEDQLLILSLCILFTYIICINVEKIYGITLLEFLIVFCIANIIYFILF